MRVGAIWAVAGLVLAGLAGAPAQAETPTVLTIFAAGTLAVPFRAAGEAFEKAHPGVQVQAEFGGSVKMAREITDLHKPADILAVADYSVIPKYLFGGEGKPAYADWYAGFVRNAVTFVYTDKSKFAKDLTAKNWYEILAKPGVEIGRSNPDTDPSGYQTLQMLDLASGYYHQPDLARRILANAPKTNIRDTETSLLSALQVGQIDYLAIYRSDALQHHLRFIALPPEIDLSDAARAGAYAKAIVHTKNGDLQGKPIVYALTIPSVAKQKALAERFVAFLLGPDGRKIMAASGFGTIAPAFAVAPEKMPAGLRTLVTPWPAS